MLHFQDSGLINLKKQKYYKTTKHHFCLHKITVQRSDIDMTYIINISVFLHILLSLKIVQI